MFAGVLRRKTSGGSQGETQKKKYANEKIVEEDEPTSSKQKSCFLFYFIAISSHLRTFKRLEQIKYSNSS